MTMTKVTMPKIIMLKVHWPMTQTQCPGNLRSKNTNSTSSHCPPYCWSKITLQLHDPQLCGYNPISGSTEVRHMAFQTHFMFQTNTVRHKQQKHNPPWMWSPSTKQYHHIRKINFHTSTSQHKKKKTLLTSDWASNS